MYDVVNPQVSAQRAIIIAARGMSEVGPLFAKEWDWEENRECLPHSRFVYLTFVWGMGSGWDLIVGKYG